jgi:transposase-like protein
MKGKKYTPEQIIAKLREADAELNGGATIGQVCQKLGISEPTFHRWREQYGGMKADAAKQLKELQQQNQRLKRAVADLTLDKQILKEAGGWAFACAVGGDGVFGAGVCDGGASERWFWALPDEDGEGGGGA